MATHVDAARNGLADRGSTPLISTNSVTIAYAVVTFSVYDNSHSYVGSFVVMVRYNVKKR